MAAPTRAESAPPPVAAAAATGACATVYYDGACPLCSREIALYQRLAGAETLRWVDVSAAAPAELGPDLTREQALARFHVREADGRLVSGGSGFVVVWRRLPATRWLAWIAARPPASWLLEPMYRLFLRIRPWLARLA
jgi:predicted DCC family thiol-disulfide oxidoreductase YuxK